MSDAGAVGLFILICAVAVWVREQAPDRVRQNLENRRQERERTERENHLREQLMSGTDWIVQRFAEHEGHPFGPRRADGIEGWARLRREAHSGKWRPPVREGEGWVPLVDALRLLGFTVAIHGTTPGYGSVELVRRHSGEARDASIDWLQM
jgi:hypothetical protein